MENDPFYETVSELQALPEILVSRLKHYFLTYKLIPGADPVVQIEETYGSASAGSVIEAAIEDYKTEFSVLGGAEN